MQRPQTLILDYGILGQTGAAKSASGIDLDESI